MRPTGKALAAFPGSSGLSRRIALLPVLNRAIPALIILLLVCSVLALQAGAVPVQAEDWREVLWPWQAGSGHSAGSYVLWQIRLPRVLFALLIGACLGLSGALTQGLFRNPLADPGLLGVSSGAAAAAALTIVLVVASQLPIPPVWRAAVLPLAAFGGALLVCFLLDRLARWLTPGSVAGLLLAGVALNALGSAVIGLCTYLANDEQLRTLSFWLLGSVAGANWLLVLIVALMLALAIWRVQYLVRAMNALALGEAAAGHVGIDVARLRSHVIILVALLSGFAVAWCGMIGFIGLIVPNLVRIWGSPDQRRVVPQSMLLGALLLLAADTLARTLVIPAEVPVGIFTALLGSPFFFFLLRQSRARIG